MKCLKLLLYTQFILLGSCSNKKEHIGVTAREKVEALWADISKGTAQKDFPTKYFPENKTNAVLYDLKNKCDFLNKKGEFINEYYPNKKQVTLIYEYYMKCDSVRFIVTYNLNDSLELYEFKMEPIEKFNPMAKKQ